MNYFEIGDRVRIIDPEVPILGGGLAVITNILRKPSRFAAQEYEVFALGMGYSVVSEHQLALLDNDANALAA